MASVAPAPDADLRQAAINDPARLAALRATRLLDTPAEESFDRLTRLATTIIGAPASFMTLVDESRDFYKSLCGPGEPLATTRQFEGVTFCQLVLTVGQPLVLDAVTAHPGYRDLPALQAMGLRAYAGVPLTTSEGRCLGSFCAVDFEPHHWREQDVALLCELACSAVREIELRQALQEATASIQAKGSFLSNMSHEIRTPMNGIIGLTHLMARSSRDPVLSDRLAKVDMAAKHLLHILNDVLDLAKIEAGKMRLESVPFDLEDLLTSSLDLVRPDAQAKQLELVLDQGSTPARVRGDVTRLRQALLNLLTNAVKFTARGSVTLRCQQLGTTAEEVRLRFEVIDTGEGIDEEAQGRLFNSFEQADQSISRRHGGTGLGLALTRQLSQLMGGDVGVHSQPGHGSRFWFTVCVGREAEPDRQALPALTRGLNALVVDDLEASLHSLCSQLSLLGIETHAAADGPQALAALEQAQEMGQTFDLVLVDQGANPMDSVSTLRAIQARSGLRATHAVLMAVHDEVNLRTFARECGFDDLLVKPVAASHLHQLLKKVLGAPLLPAYRPVDAGTHDEVLVRTAHSGKRVLLAEDNAVNQEVASELLQLAGLQVDLASDGAQALAMAEARNYDLLLLDVQMPKMDGLTLTRRLRATQGAHLPIVAMTANALPEDHQACIRAGMNDHIAKPIEPHTLYRALLRWLPTAPP